MEEQGNQQVFALDIGTRSIIGIVGHKEGDLFWVDAYVQLQHPKRAMIDGQIEDIAQVARVAGEVKRCLEENLGVRLSRVAVAAAGRALKTSRGSYTRALSGKAVDAQLQYELESSAVNEARNALNLEDNAGQYHCVGHSVVHASIDGYAFSSLLEHKGANAQVDVIATFLPSEVVSSLRRCMELIDLEIETLTLEPIAAMRAVLPKDIRLLNLAMVDIGAGTSDIAITKDGSVAGYTMATVAGDEITEAIIRHCLVDFETAETIKLALENEDPITYTDILGHTQNTTSETILKAIEPSVDILAKVIADKIQECNNSAPTAVFLVGGGSQTHGLCEKLAQELGLDTNKVALAGTQFSGRELNEEAQLNAPEHATPVGIALMAAEEMAAGGTLVQVNGQKVRLFIGGDGISVMDVLLLAGFHHNDLMAHNGQAVTFQLNGDRKVVFGSPHTVAQIQLNGQEASLTSPVYGGDVLQLDVAKNGEDAHPLVKNYLPKQEPRFSITFDDTSYTVGSVALVNGVLVPIESEIPKQAEVVFVPIDTVHAFCGALGISTQDVLCNDEPVTPAQNLAPGDVLCSKNPPQKKDLDSLSAAEKKTPAEELPPADEPSPVEEALPADDPSLVEEPSPAEEPSPVEELSPVEEALPADEPPPAEELPQAEEPLPLDSPKKNEEVSSKSMRVELNGKTIILPPKADKTAHTMLDLLPLIDIDPENPKGWVQIQKNGHEASYLEAIQSGDLIEIGWKEEK